MGGIKETKLKLPAEVRELYEQAIECTSKSGCKKILNDKMEQVIRVCYGNPLITMKALAIMVAKVSPYKKLSESVIKRWVGELGL